MKFFCISDNTDTQIGMRLAGVEGIVVHTSDEFSQALDKACKDAEIGLVLISHKLMKLCPEKIYTIKLRSKYPLVVEIPDRHGDSNISETITEYVRESIGLKI